MASFLAGLFGSSGSASAGQRAGSGAAAQTPSYSFQRLQQLYDRLSQFRESDLERAGGGDAVVETVRQITEALIWGEQNDTNFFDFFCEKSILADFIRVLGLSKTPKKVRVQLLQTLSMLVQNIRRQTSLYYLLSNNYVNKLIAMPLDFSDEEIIAYYITLLKSLAMRLDSETVKFFFIQHPEPSFPLYIEAAKFFSHRDQMVRATVRTITLQVYRVSFPPMRRFVLRHAAESYFSRLAYHLRDLWLRLDVEAAGEGRGDGGTAAVQHENELQQDLLIYLSDVFELDIPELNEVLADRLLGCALLPVLLSGVASSSRPNVNGTSQALLLSHPNAAGSLYPRSASTSSISGPSNSSIGAGGSEPASASQPRILSPVVALFLIRQVFDTFHSRVLLEPLASALLKPTVPAALAYALPHCADLGGHSPAFSTQEDLVQNTLREHFLRFLRSHEDMPFLLAAAVVHACIQNRRALPLSFLESARVFPDTDHGQRYGPSRRPQPQSPPGVADTDEDSTTADNAENPDVLMMLLQALQRHSTWHLETFQVLARIVLDIFLDPSACHHAESRQSALRAVHSEMRASAHRLRSAMQECLTTGGTDDSLLDVFFEEWELQQAALVDINEACSAPRRLLLPSNGTGGASRGKRPGATQVASSGDAKRTQTVVRCFLVLRRLLMDLVRYMPQVPWDRPVDEAQPCFWAGPSEEPLPVSIDEEVADDYAEGMAFEFGNFDRIVCGVAAADGSKHTRYLLLHDFLLLLVQPDLSTPGWAVVTTVWPLRQVQSLIDRGDPRTLRLGMRAPRGGARPAEAVQYNPPAAPSEAGEERSSSFFTLALNFEDVNRCHAANVHLQKRRQEVREKMLRSALHFVETSCTQPLPHLATA